MIYIVEDDRDTRETLAFALELNGFRVAGGAGSGGEALAELRAIARPSVILLDLMMPGMNGWQFRIEQAKEPRLAEIPVVVLTATRDGAETAASLGAAAYLEKPIDLAKLVDTVARFCARRAPESEPGGQPA